MDNTGQAGSQRLRCRLIQIGRPRCRTSSGRDSCSSAKEFLIVHGATIDQDLELLFRQCEYETADAIYGPLDSVGTNMHSGIRTSETSSFDA